MNIFQSTQPKRAATRRLRPLRVPVGISIHAAQEGCDREAPRPQAAREDFNPRSPRGLRHPSNQPALAGIAYFNPRSPRGLRLFENGLCCQCDDFNPRSPRGLRRDCFAREDTIVKISIHAAQEGCDCSFPIKKHPLKSISIHAAQEGCDQVLKFTNNSQNNFNPRSPRGLRPQAANIEQFQTIFQSTQPKRAATLGFVINSDQLLFQSTQPKRAATVKVAGVRPIVKIISIHAAQEGCDASETQIVITNYISIHAAQEGCDCSFPIKKHPLKSISIHAAQEGCDLIYLLIAIIRSGISIHAAQEGCDVTWFCYKQRPTAISIHAAQEGCDVGFEPTASRLKIISIHAAQEGCDAS